MRRVEGETVVERRDRDREARLGVGHEARHVGEHDGAQPAGMQDFEQRLAPAGRIGGDQHPAGIAAEEADQRIGRYVIARRQRQVRCGLVTERRCLGMARMLGIADLDAHALVEPLAQRVGRHPQLARRQQRPFDVVAQLVVTVGDLLPELVGAGRGAGIDHRQRGGGQVVEQRGRRHRRRTGVDQCAPRRLEEQRQVVLDACRRRARLEILVQAAAPGVDVEALAQRIHRARGRGVVQRHLATGQHAQGVDPVERTLGFGIEGADRFDRIVEQFDAVGAIGAHRVDVEQTTTHGEVAGIVDLRHMAVTGAFEPALLRFEIERLAHAQVEAVADHVPHGRQALHQRLHRHHDDAALEARQAMQGGQALGDDVRMRAEAVVGQGFPVRKRQHGQGVVAGAECPEVVLELMRAVIVASHQQQRPRVRARRLADGPGEGAAAGGRAPPGA